MRKKATLCIAYLFCISVSTAFGQTAEQIKGKYGQPIEAYSVSENIWMTPEFTNDGQICMMRLYPKRISATTNYLADTLDYWELKEVLEQIAPLETRGKRTEFFGLTLLLGQMSETMFNYENVSITFLASLHFSRVEDKRSKSSAVEKAQDKNAKKSDEEIAISRDAEIATVSWKGRTCAKK